MNPKKNAGLNQARKPFAFKLLPTAAVVVLALSSMSAIAGAGKVCLENDPATGFSHPIGSCTLGSIGTYYANSPKLRKFVDTLPGLTAGNANTFAAGKTGEYISVGVADTTTYPGSEYFVIGVVENQQVMHSDLQKATTVRGYVQLYPRQSERGVGATNPPTKATDGLTGQVLPDPVALKYPDGSPIFWPDPITGVPTTEQVYAYDKPHYLGPVILTMTGTPVRTQMVNLLPTGRATLDASGKVIARNGDMFLPVDETLGGAGLTIAGDKYPQNRVAFHLHGGDSPWISDGTPHQWIAPGADSTPYKAGNRAMNVPDMPYPGKGSLTLFWPNNQSARLMWFHDHTFGLTRQNAYGGEAAGYVIIDAAELALQGGLDGTKASSTVGTTTINKAIPNGLLDQIVLVVQDKTFVPDDIATQDSKWDTNAWGKPGDLWYPHVYEPFELWGKTAPAAGTPLASAGVNPAGRWDYALGDISGAYQPPTVGASRTDPDYGRVAFPDGTRADSKKPGSGPSATPESYMDTPVINGVAYPVLNVEPKAYRVRFLNGANDRYFNISLWKADSTSAVVLDAQGNPHGTEVKIVPPGGTFAGTTTVNTSVDPAGVPDPSTAGPAIIQFGNEAGFLPQAVVHKPQLMQFDPISGEEIAGDYFYLGSAERADTVIDFSQFAGQTLIMYNDGTAPVPGGDPRYDYYTGGVDQSPFGGAAPTAPGYGPNTRTLMQIRVAATTPAPAYDPDGNGGAIAAELPKAYAVAADTHILPAMPTAVDATTNTMTLADTTKVPLTIKTIHGFTDPNVGRLIAQLGTELPDATGAGIATPLSYIDMPTEILKTGETQYWWIKNYDVDNHPMHFHLFNVQVLAHRLHSDGSLRAPIQDEMGWKETVKNWPGEDVIVAVQPKTPELPFGLPKSVRALDPTLPAGATANEVLYGTSTANTSPKKASKFVPYAFTQLDLDPNSPTYGGPKAVSNTVQDFGWEYVWHCHILGHEENDLMRPVVFLPVVNSPGAPTSVAVDATGKVTWTDATPALDGNGTPVASTTGNVTNEIGFSVQRAPVSKNTAGIPTVGVFAALAPASPVVDGRVNTLANATSFQATPVATVAPNTSYQYQVVAVNEAGSVPSAVVTSSIAGLAAPTALAAGAYNAAAKSIGLSWTNTSASQTGVVVQRAPITLSAATGLPTNVPAFAGTPTATAVQAATAGSYTDVTGLVANTMYQYRVYGVNVSATGPETTVYAATATTLPLPTMMQSGGNSTAAKPVSSLTATVALQWQNVTSPVATGYEIQHCVGTASACIAGVWAPVPGQIKAGTSATSKVVVTGLAGKTTYQFRVRTINALVPGLVSGWTPSFQAKTL
jgi:FtsP/CotA-like multicopper oxidase with cupredoxin domain